MSYIKLYTDELKNKGLSLYDKAVYASLMTKYQYHDNKEFYTFESYIADELEISERTVKRSIKKLVEVKLITIKKRYHKQLKQTVNYYNLDTQNLSNENFVLDTFTVEPDTDIKATEIIQQNEDIEDMETNTDAEIQPITLPLDMVDYKTDEERIAEAIAEDYDSDIEQINKIADIRFTMLIDIADKTETDPQKVLDYIKEVRQIA